MIDGARAVLYNEDTLITGIRKGLRIMVQITLGTPEKQVPSLYKPESLLDAGGECRKFPEKKLAWRVTPRGIVLEFPLSEGEELFGFGLQLKGFACRHTKKVLRSNADPVANTGDSHAPVPFFVSTAGYGVCVDTLRMAEFYCGYPRQCREGQDAYAPVDSTEELYAAKETAAEEYMIISVPVAQGVTLTIFEGETITEVVSQYNLYSGGGCLPPLWGLGNTYRCYTKYNANQILETAGYFREEGLPVSCIGLEPGWQTHAYSCSFRVNEELYPDFKGMVGELRREHFHLNLWEHAFTHPSSPLYRELKPYSGDLPVWNGLVPDFALEEASERFAAYHRREFVEAGVTGFKLDECDGSDYTGSWTYPNCSEFPSGLDGEQMHQCFGVLYQQAMLRALGSQRTYSQVRNSGAYAASYPFVLYSDLYDHKDFIRGVCTSGLSGLLWCPELREGKTKEDLIRRLQTVVFSSLSMINGWYIDGIPWEQLDCREEARELLCMRMRLVPYLYSAFYTYHTTGKPPVRPLVSDYTEDRNTYGCDDQYLLGDCLLVAPMVAGEEERQVYLPQGEWYDFWTEERVEAGFHRVRTEKIPVFVKSGSLLPLAEPLPYADGETVFDLELRRYGRGGKAILVEDDGDTIGAKAEIHELDGTERELPGSRYRIRSVREIL